MPTYNASPFAVPPQAMTPGIPAYLFGSFTPDVSPTKGIVNNVALTSNVATVTVLINEGDIPAIGSLITIVGTASTSGLFNVTNVALTGVTITAATGKGTLTFALTHADVTSAADAGYFIIPQPEVGETVADGQSVPVSLNFSTPQDSDKRVESLECEVLFPTLPTACVVALQVAMSNTPATQWQTAISNVVTVSGGTATYGTTQWTGKAMFARYSISGTGGSGKIVAKLLS